MTDLLLNWINNDIVLSKPIKDIPIDFRNGYLFAELLYKTKQIPKLTKYKNSNNYKDIISNFCFLQKNLLDLGIFLDENSRNEIMNAGPYTSKIYLFKIKQILSKKNIDLEQLKIKESNTLQKLYNKICFKNDNEKYLYNLQIKIGNREQKEKSLRKSSSAAYLPILGKSIENILDKKYIAKGPIYNEFKKKYSHLNFNDNDIKIIMEDMKQNENKLLYLKDMVQSTENKRKFDFKEINAKIKKKWENSMINMEKFKINKLKDSWEPTVKFKQLVQSSFKKNANRMAKLSNNFDNNLKFLIDETGKNKNKEKISSEIIMVSMRKKLEERIKSKKDKEKRERKIFKDEQEMNNRIYSKKNMSDMVNLMDNTLKKNNTVVNDELTKINIKEETIKSEKREKSAEKIKEDKNKKDISQTIDESNADEIKSRNKSLKANDEGDNTDFNIKDLSQPLKNEEENEKNINEISEKERMGQTATSSYSKLTANDYGLGLINECLSIHNFNISVNDRIKLFKTLILPINKNEIEHQYKNLPKIDINSNSTNQSLIRNYSCSDLYDKSMAFESNIYNKNIYKFNKDLFFEELDKTNIEDFSNEFEKKLSIFKKHQNLMTPIFKEILELTEHIVNYQEQKGIYLIDNSKWDDLMIKFKNCEKFDEDEGSITITKKEDDSQYLFDYGEKITNDDNKRIFDYINYIDIFNDLIIPNELRGKKFLYPELYKDFYLKQNNHEIDIKDYEPNEEEAENLFLPYNSNIKNFKFSDIIEYMIEGNCNNFQNKIIKDELNNSNNLYEQRGKYYYLPIKMFISGYPLSGKKTQSSLLNEKYKGIKVYNPQKILENKVKEYKEYNSMKEQPDKHVSGKGKHKGKKDDKKEIEEKIKEFEPVLKIIKPYLDYINKNNKEKEKEEKEKTKKEKEENKEGGEKERKKSRKKKKKVINEEEEKKNDITQDISKTQDNITMDDNNSSNKTNIQESYIEKEELLRDIYMKLIIYQLEKDFPNDANSKIKFVEDLKQKYSEYLKLKEKIEELKIKINEEEVKEKEKEKELAEQKSKNKNKKNQVLVNLNKELDNTTKLYNTTTNSLYVGFIIIDFPKNLKEAEKFEKYFTGYESEFEKDLEESEKKLYSYGNLIDVNIKSNKRKNGQFSVFDLFIELNISPDEEERRYKGAKYDPLTGTIYHMEDNPPGKDDKKKENRLVPGIPNLSKEEFYREKINYEKNIKGLERLYKAMNNGFDKVYKNIDQTDINYIHNLNDSLENHISELIFSYYYNNIDNILKNININNNNTSLENKNKMKEDISDSSILPQIKEDNNILMSEHNSNSMEIIKNMNNNNLSEELLSELDNFYLHYKSLLKNFIHFIFRQKEHIINYLTSMQNSFITFLNRKTEKTEIAEIYIQKFNSILEEHPEVKNNPIVYKELSEDIKDVIKSIWVNIQNKKNNDVKYLKDLRNSGKKENEIHKFWEYIVLIFESEIQKYLTICEIIIKYYSSKNGIMNKNLKKEDNKSTFKVDYKKYLFEDIDIQMQSRNNIFNKDNNEQNESFMTNDSKNYIEEKINILFMNSLKIIIREDEIMRNYIIKIKERSQNNEKEIKSNIKLVNNSTLSIEATSKKLNSSFSSRSIPKKKIFKKTKTTEFMVDNLMYEEIKNQIINEKRKFKYRLMFLKYYAIRYINIINNCYNEAYNALDDLIIMSVRSQNSTLNEFMNYLEKALNNFNNKISLDNFEFDSYDIYRRYKVDINILYANMKNNVLYNNDRIKLLNIKDEENKKKTEKIYVTEEDMSYIQLFSYNLNDLMYIYNYTKTYGADTCNFLVKYDIVKEILIHQYFTKKNYGIYENNKNDANDNNSLLNQIISEENNGICFKILFLSNINYTRFLNKFTVHNNNYININELFSSLLLLGSQLINADKFMELIKEYIPESKRDAKIILLTKEEFMKIPMWFEKDDYLNVLVDSKEQEYYYDITKYYYSEEKIKEDNNENKPIKINSVKESLFEINSEDNILDLNKLVLLINKINGVEEKKEKESNNISKINANTIIKKEEIDLGNNSSLNEENIKNDMNISKGKENESKGSLTMQSEVDIKRKRKYLDKENINNIFNALFA